MKKIFLFISLLAGFSANRGWAQPWALLDAKRVANVEKKYCQVAEGFARPCADRKFWEAPEVQQALAPQRVQAEKLLGKEFPAWKDDSYLEFSRNGRRIGGELMLRHREAWLAPLVLAECLENQGRFVDKINLILEQFAEQRTWTLPAHDADLKNFFGREYSVDLNASAWGAELAQALYLLGDKVNPEIRKKILEDLSVRVFDPVLHSLKTGKGSSWLTLKNNWNSHCLFSVTVAALAALPKASERAVFFAAAEHYIANYLKGYKDDGYCTEGVGYWNYGFGAFLGLRARLFKASDGEVDLLKNPVARNAALYGFRIQLLEGSAPPFSDCIAGTRPNAFLLDYCNRALGLGLLPQDSAPVVWEGTLVGLCLSLEPVALLSATPVVESDLRSYFERSQVLVCRPGKNSAARLSAAVKSDGNGSHSHDDIGSYVVALGPIQFIGDPGGPKQYEKGTFDHSRYTFPFMNSFGHPVPKVAGQLQIRAEKARPQVVSTSFTDDEDQIQIDLTSAYAVAKLKKLIRTWRYSRKGSGSLTVKDEFEFASPAAFEIALPTRAEWRRGTGFSLQFASGTEVLVADISASANLEVSQETIRQDIEPFTRLGLAFSVPQKSGYIEITYHPEKK